MTSKSAICITVNGKIIQTKISEDDFLLNFLREELGLLGVKNGCNKGHCGTCTVIINGKATRSCITKMKQLDNCSIETIEHLSHDGKIHPLQYAFVKESAVQCGFCSPGMIMASKALLDTNPSPTEKEIRSALKNNLCRCTGYASIVKAVQTASQIIKSGISEVDPETIEYGPLSGPVLGKSIINKNTLGLATGKTKFGNDLIKDGMLHGKVRWSDYPFAKILSIDASVAKKMPGVHVILTGKDVPGENKIGILRKDQPAIAYDFVRFIGDPVAAVFAESEKIATEAIKALKINYLPLEGVFSPEDAASPGAPKIHENGNLCHESFLERGDIEKAFSNSKIIIENTYTTPFIEHAFLEPESGIAWPDNKGGVVLEIGTQTAFDDRAQLSSALALPEEKIRIIQLPMGGAFGAKEDIVLDFLLALGAIKSGRPVKMVLTREESLRVHPKRHAAKMHYKTGASADGHLLAVQSEVIIDTGAYASLGPDVMENMLSFGAGPYYVPNLKMSAKAYYTNNITAGAMRGFGVPQVTFAMESQMDEMARALGMDVIEFRLLNALDVGLPLASDHILEASVGIKQTLRECQRALKKISLPKTNKEIGVGVASSLKNIGFGHGSEETAGAIIELNENGTFELKVGVADYGQGSKTAFAQLSAQELGVSFDVIDVASVDTSMAPPTGATTASRQTYLSGNAVLMASRELKKKIFEAAEEELNIPSKDMDIRDGKLINIHNNSSYDLSLLKTHLIAESRYKAPMTKPFTEKPSRMGSPDFISRPTHFTYAYVTHIAIVEVDEKNGEVKVLKVIAAQDVGKAINPQIIKGQIEGSVVMGMGYGISEEFILDKGINVTNSLLRCHLPTFEDQPEVISIIVEDSDPNGPYGVKGVGEASILPTAAAIANAIYDAVGVRITSLPANKKRVLAAIMEKRK